MITPVLLCGGSGTRLWPLSRESYPKQFVPLVGQDSLFQQTVKRLSGPDFADPVILTNAEFRFIVTEQLADAGQGASAILIEPEGRNTAPALLAAALHVSRQDPDALILAAPSDHVIRAAEAFRTAVATGIEPAKAGRIVTFGVTPRYPETGYGYLQIAGTPTPGAVADLLAFVEKPDAPDAARMVEAGTFFWNAGIFLFTAGTLISACKAHAPDLIEPVERALDLAEPDFGFLRLDPMAWSTAPQISIDYAVMERADNLSVVPFDAGWTDLGGWDAIWRESGPDAHGVARHGPVTDIACRNTLLRSESPGTELVAIGLQNMLAVAMPDAVLVADMSRAQEVRAAVKALQEKGVAQTATLPKTYRPWGQRDTLALGDGYSVNRISVHPGRGISLQRHQHRSEHWVVISGTARLTLDGKTHELTANQSIGIPAGAVHRLDNPGPGPLIVIEVQTGSYLGDDDITRYGA